VPSASGATLLASVGWRDDPHSQAPRVSVAAGFLATAWRLQAFCQAIHQYSELYKLSHYSLIFSQVRVNTTIGFNLHSHKNPLY